MHWNVTDLRQFNIIPCEVLIKLWGLETEQKTMHVLNFNYQLCGWTPITYGLQLNKQPKYVWCCIFDSSSNIKESYHNIQVMIKNIFRWQMVRCLVCSAVQAVNSSKSGCADAAGIRVESRNFQQNFSGNFRKNSVTFPEFFRGKRPDIFGS